MGLVDRLAEIIDDAISECGTRYVSRSELPYHAAGGHYFPKCSPEVIARAILEAKPWDKVRVRVKAISRQV